MKNFVLLIGLIISAHYMNDASEAKNLKISQGIERVQRNIHCSGYKEVLENTRLSYSVRYEIKKKYKSCMNGETR